MPIRPIAPNNPTNFGANPAPLPTTPVRADAIGRGTRPDLHAAAKQSLSEKSIEASSTAIRDSIPPQQGGLVAPKQILEPTKKGYSRSSVFNLLVAQTEGNLKRQLAATQEAENKTVQKTLEERQAGL